MEPGSNQRIERQIVIGLIVSTEFIKGIEPYWDANVFKSRTAKRMARWCWDYYTQHKEAPGKHIELIFWERVKKDKLPKDMAEEIELEILPSLSDEFEHTSFNVGYVLAQALTFLSERRIENLIELVKTDLSAGLLKEAEKRVLDFNSTTATEAADIIDLSSPKILQSIDAAFAEVEEPLFKVPGALGDMLNPHLIRGGFIAFLAREKMGKTWILTQLSIMAAKQGVNVAFFQAGDMTRNQFLRRVAVNRTHRNIDSKYCTERYVPVRDCMYNQCDMCSKRERSGSFGVFSQYEIEEDFLGLENFKKKVTQEKLIEKLEEFPDYEPCTHCKEFRNNAWGAVWLAKKKAVKPLTRVEAKTAFKRFFIKQSRRFKLATYPNGTLSMDELNLQLDRWEKEEGFIPDMVVTDYADLFVEPTVQEERAKQNVVWKKMRGTSQKRHCLKVTVTQADAASYEQSSLKLKNFSEDKRKYAHVTAFFGINQDPKGREKKLKIVRLNELVIREGDFDLNREVIVLQDLAAGQAIIGSMW